MSYLRSLLVSNGNSHRSCRLCGRRARCPSLRLLFLSAPTAGETVSNPEPSIWPPVPTSMCLVRVPVSVFSRQYALRFERSDSESAHPSRRLGKRDQSDSTSIQACSGLNLAGRSSFRPPMTKPSGWKSLTTKAADGTTNCFRSASSVGLAHASPFFPFVPDGWLHQNEISLNLILIEPPLIVFRFIRFPRAPRLRV
jgi:hypothetical protein